MSLNSLFVPRQSNILSNSSVEPPLLPRSPFSQVSYRLRSNKCSSQLASASSLLLLVTRSHKSGLVKVSGYLYIFKLETSPSMNSSASYLFSNKNHFSIPQLSPLLIPLSPDSSFIYSKKELRCSPSRGLAKPRGRPTMKR